MTLTEMIKDLRDILEDWEYEPGKISVRKIVGGDGEEKIQTRVDLGVLQLCVHGRPDGGRPRGFESLLEYHEHRLIEHVQRCGEDTDFVLTPEAARDLRHEGYLYYQRYLSLFVLEEYDGVVRDTARNLRLMDFMQRYAANEPDRHALEPQRPYVVMMYTRARALMALETDQHERALRLVEGGLHRVEELLQDLEDEPSAVRSEIRLLHELQERILSDMPDNARPKLEAKLSEAIAAEQFEQAAKLRDQLDQLSAPGVGA